MLHPDIFSFGESPVRPSCAQKQNACTRQTFDIRAATPDTTAQRWGAVYSSEENVFGIGRGTGRKKASFYKNALFPSRYYDKIHVSILTADRHPAFMHLTTNGAITVSDAGAVRPKPPGSASQGHLLFSCGCLIRACIMARAVLALLYSEYPRCERPKQKSLRKAGFLTYGLRRRLPPRNDGDRHADLKKVFSGLDRGLGEGRGSFYKKRPSFPQLKPR